MRMTDFIAHYYTISLFSSPNKKKVQKKKLSEKKKSTPSNKWLNFKKEFWCQDTTFAELASLVKTLVCLTYLINATWSNSVVNLKFVTLVTNSF